MKKYALTLGLWVVLFVTNGLAQTINFTQNFDSMGTGTTAPAGWSVLVATASGNSFWSSTAPITQTGVTMNPGTGLTLNNAPTANNNNGYNALGASALATDHCIATAPTSIAGVAIQYSSLVNNSGSSLNSFDISYDIKRFTAGSAGADELPGYWLFYSLDGTTWNNVAALNPTLANVPNTVGVTSIATTTVTLASPWVNGGSLSLRWVDDNGIASSPDQILGLDNVHLSAGTGPVPEPASWSLLALGALAFIARRRMA
ncbi:MAG: PEP-CTERM sorting domain-containing protein [Verrucomicrobia bacterium]|nr:PEP-CTERM sorting domain-containing protein [Verrucomicrobiota bacterium]